MPFKTASELKAQALGRFEKLKSSASQKIEFKNPSSQDIQKKMKDPANRYKEREAVLPDVKLPDLTNQLDPEVKEALAANPLPPLPKLSELLKDEN